MSSNIPTRWANGEPISDADRSSIELLRSAGCTCKLPLLGERSGVGPRCRLCNTEAKRTSKLITALDRSIADAQKICRRHASNPAINTKAFDAAQRLLRTLHEIKQKEESRK